MTLGRVDNVDQRSPLIRVHWHVNEASLPASESSLASSMNASMAWDFFAPAALRLARFAVQSGAALVECGNDAECWREESDSYHSVDSY